MHYAVRQFASRIVLVHLALLVVMLAIVLFAADEVNERARQQALGQARERQELLASQTAHAIQSFYASILGDLELLRPSDPDNPDTEYVAPRRAETRPFRSGPRGAVVAPLLSQQLQGRISHLFVVDKATMRPRWVGIDGDPTLPSVKEVVARVPWLQTLAEPAIEPLVRFGERGLSLVAFPVNDRTNAVLVAAVPARRLQHLFLDEVEKHSPSGAFLVDDSMIIMSASPPALLGANVRQSPSEQFRAVLIQFQQDSFRGTREVSKPFMLGATRFAPTLITVEPVHVADKRWFLLIASPLADVDSVVRELFSRAVWWAIFLAASIAGILGSTSVQLIRARLRLERVRHELVDRELKQAREIQLAWLPEKRDRMGQAVDIATVNQPASHISGDFYNFFELPDGRTVVCIGDVTGHGMAAAFLMATTQLLVRNTMPRIAEPARCLEEVNRQLCVQVFNGQFVTMQILVLDVEAGRLDIATAGHPAPLVSDGERYQPLPLEPQLVLGLDPEAAYTTESFPLAADAGVLLYTDGVVDIQRPNGNRFGIDGVRRCLDGHLANAQEILDCVLSSVNEFRGNQRLEDDLTLVVIRLQLDAMQTPAAI